MLGVVAAGDLGMGTTMHAGSRVSKQQKVAQSVMISHNSLVTDGAILLAVDFSMRADIRSGPFAFDTSSAQRRLSPILNSLHRISSGQ